MAVTTLGNTLKQIDLLKSQVCAKVGASTPVKSWDVGGSQAGDLIINGQVFQELSASCKDLVQRVCKLEGELLHNGVCIGKKEIR